MLYYSDPTALMFLIFILLIAILIGWAYSVVLVVRLARESGSTVAPGLLWFIGFFAPLGAIVVGIYALALQMANGKTSNKQDKLPPL